MTYDDLPFGEPTTPPNFGAPPPKRCAHPRSGRFRDGDGLSWCGPCGALIDPTRAKVGKSVLQRSKREERKLARDYGGIRTGHHGGPDDVQTALLNVQSKAGTSWWSARYALELDKLPRTGGRSPALIVSNGQPGPLCRRVVVMDEKDFRALYGDRILDGDAA